MCVSGKLVVMVKVVVVVFVVVAVVMVMLVDGAACDGPGCSWGCVSYHLH